MNGIKGCYKFLEILWKLQSILVDGDTYSKELETSLHKTIKKVTDDYDRMKFNTGIATLMAFINDVTKAEKINKAEFKTFITLLNPVAPHITEELWQIAGFEGNLSDTKWPTYDEAKTVDNEVEVVVQINGKIRDKMMISADLDPKGMEEVALSNDKIKALVDGKQVVKVIAVPKKLINIVVK